MLSQMVLLSNITFLISKQNKAKKIDAKIKPLTKSNYAALLAELTKLRP